MPIHYVTHDALPPEPQLGSLLDLLTTVFANQSRAEWLADLTQKAASHSAFQTLLALDGEKVVGCKVGYDHTLPNTFYSWLGGVDPVYRGQGIAGELMRQQHDSYQAASYGLSERIPIISGATC